MSRDCCEKCQLFHRDCRCPKEKGIDVSTICHQLMKLNGVKARNTSELSHEQIRKLIVQNEIYKAALEQILDEKAMRAANERAKACWTTKGHIMTIIEYFETRFNIAKIALSDAGDVK